MSLEFVYLVESEEDIFLGELQERADKCHKQIYCLDEFFASLPSNDGVTEQSFAYLQYTD